SPAGCKRNSAGLTSIGRLGLRENGYVEESERDDRIPLVDHFFNACHGWSAASRGGASHHLFGHEDQQYPMRLPPLSHCDVDSLTAILKMPAARLRTSTGYCGRSSDQPSRFWNALVMDQKQRPIGRSSMGKVMVKHKSH